MKTADRSPPSHDELVQRVEALVDRRRYGQARSSLNEGLRSFPDSLPLLYLTAFVDWAEDRNDDAHRTLKQLLSLDPEHYGGRILLGRLLAERKSFADAERVWIELLRQYPEDADICGAYGDLMLRTLHVDKALRLAKEGLRREPEHEDCLYVAAMCGLIEGRNAGDNLDLATLIRQHPERLQTGVTLVVALSDRGQSRAALSVAQELLRSDPGTPELVENVRILKARTHWSMLPLYPIQRWGWPAAIGMWVAFAFGMPIVAPGLPPSFANTVTIIWVIYALYSWIWPPLLRRLI